jgi:predicted dienelactone hydrolase
MRTLELALLLADLLAFVALAVQRLRALNRLGWAALVAPAVAAAQVVIEGSRWQMVPAYALSVLFPALWLRAPSPSRARGFASTALVVLGVLALLGAAALPAVFPVFRFPRPTGPYAIGTLTYHWIDSTRPEVFTADPSDRRELMVQLWYPARYQRGAARAPYVEHPETLQPLARLLGLPGFTLSYLDQVRTRAVDSAPAAGGPYPVLIFAHGRGGYRQHNTALVQELVSHGYVVAAMDQPGAASGVAFPDGRMAPFDPRMFDPSAPGHPPFLDSVIPFLARDASFTLDRLAALDTGDPEGILTRRLDLRHAGMFGVSLGGTVTAEACRRDPRLRACLMMDTFMPADVVASGLRQPAMWLTRDSASMRLERWPERDIDETQGTMRAVFGTLPGDGYLVLVPGAFHPNFSDMPLFSPLVRRLGLVGPIDPRRGLQIVDAFSLAFFERELKGRPARLLERPADRFPEVRFERRGDDPPH